MTTRFETVTLPGTGDSQDLLREVAKQYMSQYPERHVIIPDSVSSEGGVKAVGTGEAPVGRVARYPLPNEIAAYGEFNYTEFARIPVVFVVSSDVGVRNLSEAQICDIYAGRVTNWKEVGGQDAPIKVQSRPEGGSNMVTIRQKMACFTDLEMTPQAHYNYRNHHLHETMKAVPNAIGFMPLSEAMLHGFPVLSLDGVEPDEQNYKLNIGLGFVHKQPFSSSMIEFMNYLSTAPMKKMMRETGHVPVL